MIVNVKTLQKKIKALGNPSKALILQRFFKTGPGQYGEGDVFLGIIVPEQRRLAREYSTLSLEDVQKILGSKIHEFRLIGLLILVSKYEQANSMAEKEDLVNFYLKNSAAINNWDLVDLSVYKILGDFLVKQSQKKKILDDLSQSSNLWERRMAMVATFAFIKSGSARETVNIAKKLLKDNHDLIHKAVGWMLREMGNRVNKKELLNFLDQHSQTMPRTALRYAIEKLSDKERKYYLNK